MRWGLSQMERSLSKVSFAEALAQVSPPQIGVRCYTCAMLFEMDEADRLAFEDALASPLSATVIVKAMERAGYKASRGSLQRHRRGECKAV